MSFGIALASGFIREKNLMDKERRKAESDAALRSEEFDTAVKLAKEQSAIDFDRATRVADYNANIAETTAAATWTREASKRDREAFFTSFDKLTDAQKEAAFKQPEFVAQWKKYTGVGFSDDFVKTANAMADADTVKLSLGSLNIVVPDNYKEKLADSDLGVRSATWFNAHKELALQDPDKFVEVLQGDDTLRIGFLKDLETYGNYHNLFTANKASNKTTGETRAYLPFEQSYAPLVDILVEAGFDVGGIAKKSYKSAVLQTAVDGGVIDNPANALVLQSGDAIKPIEDERMVTNITAIANRAGFPDAQSYVDQFESLVPEGTTIPEIYRVLYSAADYQDKMYHLTVKGKGSTDTLVNFGADLTEDFGNDRLLMAQAASTLIEKKQEDTMLSQGVLTREQKDGAFKKATGHTIEEVQTAQKAGVSLQSQIAMLSDSVQVAGTSGFVRVVQQLGISIIGDGGSVDQIFKADVTGNLYTGDTGTVNPNDPKYTTQAMLQETTNGFFGKKAGEALSRIEAAKVALAISMARAADPSGRLSNQDFEVQLARLGQTGFFGDTIPQMKEKLKLIAEQFRGDLRRVEVLNTFASDDLTPESIKILEADRQVQRALDAYTLNNLRGTRVDRSIKADTPEEAPIGVEGLSVYPGVTQKGTGATVYRDDSYNVYVIVDGKPVAVEDENLVGGM